MLIPLRQHNMIRTLSYGKGVGSFFYLLRPPFGGKKGMERGESGDGRWDKEKQGCGVGPCLYPPREMRRNKVDERAGSQMYQNL